MALNDLKLLRELGDGTFSEDLTGGKFPVQIEIPYDNSGSGLAAATVQAAIDEVAGMSGGVSAFTALTDAPSSYVGQH